MWSWLLCVWDLKIQRRVPRAQWVSTQWEQYFLLQDLLVPVKYKECNNVLPMTGEEAKDQRWRLCGRQSKLGCEAKQYRIATSNFYKIVNTLQITGICFLFYYSVVSHPQFSSIPSKLSTAQLMRQWQKNNTATKDQRCIWMFVDLLSTQLSALMVLLLKPGYAAMDHS